MPSTVYVNSKAKRPKNSWLIQVRRVSEVYQAELIYTNSKGDTGPFSSSSQNVSVNIGIWRFFTTIRNRKRPGNRFFTGFLLQL